MAAKVRPALVMSIAYTDTERALVTLVPHTTSRRDSRFEVELGVPFLKAGAFDAQAIVTLPVVRLVRWLGRLEQHQLSTVEEAVANWLVSVRRTETAHNQAGAPDRRPRATLRPEIDRASSAPVPIS